MQQQRIVEIGPIPVLYTTRLPTEQERQEQALPFPRGKDMEMKLSMQLAPGMDAVPISLTLIVEPEEHVVWRVTAYAPVGMPETCTCFIHRIWSDPKDVLYGTAKLFGVAQIRQERAVVVARHTE